MRMIIKLDHVTCSRYGDLSYTWNSGKPKDLPNIQVLDVSRIRRASEFLTDLTQKGKDQK